MHIIIHDREVINRCSYDNGVQYCHSVIGCIHELFKSPSLFGHDNHGSVKLIDMVLKIVTD